MTTQRISSSQFATAFRLKPAQFAWLLGAGASATAGVPTGYDLITDFKKQLYCQLSGTRLEEVDASDPLWVERINALLQLRSSLPPPCHPEEYAAAFEAVYPNPEDRRKYIEQTVRSAVPSFGHRVLAALINTHAAPCIFTTNFDQLVERATIVASEQVAPNDRVDLTVAAIDSAGRAELCLRESNWPLLAKLHGDFQSVDLKNTSGELREQDSRMRSVLTGACTRFGLIVVGYSGRDASVMTALADAAAQPGAFPGGIYWISRKGNPLLPAVVEFLELAAARGIATAVVESQTFDELAADIADGSSLPASLVAHVFAGMQKDALRESPLPRQEARRFPVLQCSSLPVLAMPTIARRIQLNQSATTAQVRQAIKDAKVKAAVAMSGRDVVAFGNDEQLLKALQPFGAALGGTVQLAPHEDSWARGLIYDALTRAICRGKPLMPRLRRAGHAVLTADIAAGEQDERAKLRAKQLAELRDAYSAALTGRVQGFGYPYFEGVTIRLDHLAGQWWCAFEPTTFVDVPREIEEPRISPNGAKRIDPSTDWRRERWAQRYNKVWAKIIGAWANLLSGHEGDGTLRAFDVQENHGIDAHFRLSSVTGWSRASHDHPYFSRGR